MLINYEVEHPSINISHNIHTSTSTVTFDYVSYGFEQSQHDLLSFESYNDYEPTKVLVYDTIEIYVTSLIRDETPPTFIIVKQGEIIEN